MENVGGQALGPGLEVDVNLRDEEGGVGSNLEENKGYSWITMPLELKLLVLGRKSILSGWLFYAKAPKVHFSNVNICWFNYSL